MSKKPIIAFDDMFKYSIIPMRIMRLHPEIPYNFQRFLEIALSNVIFFFAFIIVIFNVYCQILVHDYFEVCRFFYFALMFYGEKLNVFILFVYRKNIAELIELMKSDYNQDLSEDEQQIVIHYAKLGRKESLMWFLVSLYAPFIFMAKHFFWEVYTYITDEWKLLPFMPMKYPAAIQDYADNPYIYMLLYFTFVFYLFNTSNSFAAVPPLGPIFMLHAQGQFEIVEKRLLSLYVNTSTEEAEIKLRDIVKRLMYIYRFVGKIQVVYGYYYEIILKSTTFALPMAAFQNLEAIRGGLYSTCIEYLSLEFLNFFLGTILYSSVPCYYSDKLMDKGEAVRQAIYGCGWEARYHRGQRKTLLILLTLASRPTLIKTPFRNVNLETLALVLNQAYAIFNIINAAWREN